MLSESQKLRIIEFKSLNWTWRNIAIAISSKVEGYLQILF